VSASNRRQLFLVGIIFIAFISLGLPDGLLDIANPRIRATFEVEPDLFSLIFVTGVMGYSLSGFFAGQLVQRLGIGLLLSGSCFMTALALFGNAVAPAWIWFVLLGLAGGAGAGAIDAGLNTYVATNHGPRMMFWLHAFFGVGVTSGTWLMSLVVNSGKTWRLGYAIVGGMQIALALCFLLTRTRWNQPSAHAEQPTSKPVRTPIRESLRLPVVWLGVALFFLYTGAEVTAGRWSTSLFIEGRNIKASTAGLWVSAYWGMFTFGRVMAGVLGRWLTPLSFLRLSLIESLAATLLLVANPFNWSGGVALPLLGFAFAPIFPILVSITPGRVGAAHAANTIGFQIAAAGLGAAVLPGLTGVLAKITSITAMPVVLLVTMILILILHELSQAAKRSRATVPTVPTVPPASTVPSPQAEAAQD